MVMFRMTGLDQLERKLRQFGERAKKMERNPETLSLKEILAYVLPQPQEWLDAGPQLPIKSFDEFMASPEWNDYVRRTTTFPGAQELIRQAVANRVRDKVFG